MGWTTDERVAIVGHGVSDRFFSREPREHTPRRCCCWAMARDEGGRLPGAKPFRCWRARIRSSLVCAGTLAGSDEVLASFDPDASIACDGAPACRSTGMADIYKEADVLSFRAATMALASPRRSNGGTAADRRHPGRRGGRSLQDASGALRAKRDARHRRSDRADHQDPGAVARNWARRAGSGAQLS